MNVLLSSYSFFPSIGGLETVSAILAREFVHAGHPVKLVTQTPSTEVDDFPFEVIRQPTALHLLSLVYWCDFYLQNNVSLLLAWPLLLIRRPWVVAHHIWLSPDWKGHLKRFLLRFANGVSISPAIAADFPPSVVIPDPYDNTVFYERPEISPRPGHSFRGKAHFRQRGTFSIGGIGQPALKWVVPYINYRGGRTGRKYPAKNDPTTSSRRPGVFCRHAAGTRPGTPTECTPGYGCALHLARTLWHRCVGGHCLWLYCDWFGRWRLKRRHWSVWTDIS